MTVKLSFQYLFLSIITELLAHARNYTVNSCIFQAFSMISLNHEHKKKPSGIVACFEYLKML
jgi:hypothetical protein